MDDEARFGGCDRIFGVLEWAGLNGSGWACVAMIEQRAVVIFGE